ncbi:pilus assembly protein [Vibrio sp. 99-70-13A1]|nr:TadE/TadG family type IV pilus assembly protein [Vibrio sp. 99-70-13A1]NOH95862.1 pilus assembly protein [Vibrio sp. 99-70-13A1]
MAVAHKSKQAAAHKSKQSGIAVIEFTAVVAFFLTLILTIIDIGMYGYVKLTMQQAVREGARYAVTGQSNLDPDGASNREAAIIQKITDSSNGLLSRVIETDDIRVEDLYGNAVTGFGGPGDIIAIHLDCEWSTTSPYILPFVEDGTYKFTVSAAMKNESF